MDNKQIRKLQSVNDFPALVEYLPREGHSVGYIISDHEKEVMGIDDLSALLKAQKIYQQRPKGIGHDALDDVPKA